MQNSIFISITLLVRTLFLDIVFLQHISNYHIEPVKNGNYLMISSVDVADEDKYTCAVSTIKREEISHALRVRSKNWKIYFQVPNLLLFPLRHTWIGPPGLQ